MEPDLYSYLDYRAYLADWFDFKKRSNTRYSYRVFARAAGLKSSSLLHHVVAGKRNLTATTLAAFAAALKLDRNATSFFSDLVQLDQAKSAKARNEVWDRISARRRFRDARELEGDGFRYLSDWYIPAIRELALLPGFQADPVWIAKSLRPRISVTQARRALDVLLRLDMLAEADDGTLRPSEGSIVTPHEVSVLAVHNYHQAMLARATEALEFDPEDRHFGAVTVAVPVSSVAGLKEAIAAFQERVLDLCDSAEAPAERVYQLNLQLFPLSTHIAPPAPPPTEGT